MNQPVNINACGLSLQSKNPWKIASSQNTGQRRTVVVELAGNGVRAFGEALPSKLYNESADAVLLSLNEIDASKLSFANIPESMEYLGKISGLPVAARCAVNLALLDGAAKLAQCALHDFLGLKFHEGRHLTSFSIGIDTPEVIRQKALSAAAYPVLKLKLGVACDRENLAALRDAAPHKLLRLDANEGWKTRKDALQMLEWLAATDQKIQFVEQPMPRQTPPGDLLWLKERSPLPLFADESCHTAKDIPHCAECFHGVNVKLIKTGGISMAVETLLAARKAGLKTMIGCMLETSLMISAAAQLADLADYLDLDGNLLISNDPFEGVTTDGGILSFASAKEKYGLRANWRPGYEPRK